MVCWLKTWKIVPECEICTYFFFCGSKALKIAKNYLVYIFSKFISISIKIYFGGTIWYIYNCFIQPKKKWGHRTTYPTQKKVNLEAPPNPAPFPVPTKTLTTAHSFGSRNWSTKNTSMANLCTEWNGKISPKSSPHGYNEKKNYLLTGLL